MASPSCLPISSGYHSDEGTHSAGRLYWDVAYRTMGWLTDSDSAVSLQLSVYELICQVSHKVFWFMFSVSLEFEACYERIPLPNNECPPGPSILDTGCNSVVSGKQREQRTAFKHLCKRILRTKPPLRLVCGKTSSNRCRKSCLLKPRVLHVPLRP